MESGALPAVTLVRSNETPVEQFPWRYPVFVDIGRYLERRLRGRLPTGVDRVNQAYLDHLGRSARALVRFGGRWLVPREAVSRRLIAALRTSNEMPNRQIRADVALAWLVHPSVPTGALVLNLGHSGTELADYSSSVRRRGLRVVYFLHDLIPITHPEYCRPGEADRHEHRIATMLETAKAIVVSSEVTRQALSAHASRLGLRIPPCILARLGPGLDPSSADTILLKRPYFLVLGTIEPRKNHLMLLHVWRELVRLLGSGAPALVLIGQRGWECEQVIDLLERCKDLRGHVMELSSCPDGELANWIRHARGLLFPSFVEGYGLPLVEALALGVPVLASDLPVFHEIAGEVPDYIDPIDGVAWLERILEYGREASDYRDAQLERLKHYRPPSWRDHFSTVDAGLRELERRS